MRRLILALALGGVCGQPSVLAGQDDPRLVALGGMMASDLYVKQMYIDAVRDALLARAYDSAAVEQKMRVLAQMTSINIDQLNKVQGLNLAPNEKEALAAGIAIYKLLQDQANKLAAHARENTAATKKALEESRKETWEKMGKLLGIK